MQSPIDLHGVSFKQNPRNGQRRVFDAAAKVDLKELNIKLPTGYGKTFTATGVYAIRQKNFDANRLLYITPTTAQHQAFCQDGHHDLLLSGVAGPRKIVDIGYFGIEALKKHRLNSHQVFATTIQAICCDAGYKCVVALLETGRWVIVVDEYHHYGVDKTWGQKVRSLNSEFTLAMSATPYRPKEDSAFGEPSIIVSYRTAVAEGAVKRLKGHSYIYRIDAINAEGEIESMTTSELAGLAGSTDPEAIEKYKISRKMRWSPKYVSPLVSVPIERMISERVSSGYKLQAIIGAMCVSHAELVCEQLRAMFPELSIDWVGTGENGRSIEKNQEILKKFCPAKEETSSGIQRGEPTLDALVHVGMAGEGLDTRNVSEVTHLNCASLNNSNNQENGRSSRPLGNVVGHINYDSTSGYSAYVGDSIMDAMDLIPPNPESDDNDDTREPKPLPEEPTITIWNMELIEIDSGNPEVARFTEALRATGHATRTLEEMVKDPDNSELRNVVELFKRMRRMEAEEHNEKSIIQQWKDSVDNALTVLTSRVIKAMIKNGQRIEKSMAGDIKKRINRRKKTLLGPVIKEVDSLRKHYKWIQSVESSIISSGVLPSWLQ